MAARYADRITADTMNNDSDYIKIKGTCTGCVAISSAVERIEELENALKKITETIPNSYKDCRYLPAARLDIIADIC